MWAAVSPPLAGSLSISLSQSVGTPLVTLHTLPWSPRHLSTNPIRANVEDMEHVFMFLKKHNPFSHPEPHSDNLIWTVSRETREQAEVAGITRAVVSAFSGQPLSTINVVKDNKSSV